MWLTLSTTNLLTNSWNLEDSKMTARSVIIACLFVAVTSGCAADSRDARIRVRVLDEKKTRLANVPVHFNTLIRMEAGEGFGTPIYKHELLSTEAEGLVGWASPSLDGEFSYWVSDFSGYYGNGGNYKFPSSDLLRWQPWNPTVEI